MAEAASQMRFRSISLPSRLHPLNSTGHEPELRKLDSCFSSDAPVASESIRSCLLCLAELYSSLPQNHCRDRKSVEDSLESSAQLLDSCNTIRELVQTIRELARGLQSSFRRKGLTSPAVQSDVDSYFRSRKKMNKCVAKSLKALKSLENRTGSGQGAGDEAMRTTVAVFRSSLSFLSLPAGRLCRWNLVSRLTRPAGVVEGAAVSEVGCVDALLNGLRQGDQSKAVFDVQRSLQNLDACVEGIEVGLQRLFRQLLQSRVALLNILTDQILYCKI